MLDSLNHTLMLVKIQGFTGHIPNMRGAHGLTTAKALVHVSNTVPPLSPMVHVAWSKDGTRRTVTVPEVRL